VFQYFLQTGDILFARTGGTVGKSYLVEDCPKNAIYASYLIRTRFFTSLNYYYIKYFFESPFYWQQIMGNVFGTGQPNFNGKKLADLTIPLPPLKEQDEIVNKVESLLAKVTELENQIQERKTLSEKLAFGIIKEKLEE
jgi:type I restriction enzyme S subunit